MAITGRPTPRKFPHGLKPIVEKGKKLGIRIGLWFNPSIQNDFADWQKDAQAIIGLYKKYGICCFKIDGLQIPTKTAEQNLRRLFDTVLEQTNYEVIFNLDATAGRRGGYHYMNEYGNIFSGKPLYRLGQLLPLSHLAQPLDAVPLCTGGEDADRVP